MKTKEELLKENEKLKKSMARLIGSISYEKERLYNDRRSIGVATNMISMSINEVLVEFKHDFETARLFEEAMYEGRDSYREMVKMSKRNW